MIRSTFLFIGLVSLALSMSIYAAQERSNIDQAVLDSISKNKLKKFKKIIRNGYDVNGFIENDEVHWLMCDVTRHDRLAFLKFAIESGGDVNLLRTNTSQRRATPLKCALTHRNREAINFLLEAGADPNIVVCPNCAKEHQISHFMEALLNWDYRIAYELLDVVSVTKRDLETIRFMLEDVRSIQDEEISQESYRLKLAAYLEGKGFKLNIWTADKEESGEWMPTFLREED